MTGTGILSKKSCVWNSYNVGPAWPQNLVAVHEMFRPPPEKAICTKITAQKHWKIDLTRKNSRYCNGRFYTRRLWFYGRGRNISWTAIINSTYFGPSSKKVKKISCTFSSSSGTNSKTCRWSFWVCTIAWWERARKVLHFFWGGAKVSGIDNTRFCGQVRCTTFTHTILRINNWFESKLDPVSEWINNRTELTPPSCLWVVGTPRIS